MKKVTFLTIFIILLSSINLLSEKSYKDYQVISKTENSITIEYSPKHFSFDTVIVNNREYLKPNFYLASPVNDIGEPRLQVRNFTIGIPQSGKVSLRILSVDYKKVEGIRILPVPIIKKDGEFIKEVYEEGDTFKRSGMIPENVAELIKPGYIRNQRVVTLKISPVQYNPAEKLALVYNKIQ